MKPSPAEVDVAPPQLCGTADGADAEARALVHRLVDGDDVLAQNQVVGHALELAVGVAVLAAGQVRDAAGVRLDVDVDVVLADAGVGAQFERAEVVVLVGDIQLVLGLRRVRGGRDVESVAGQDLFEEPDHVAGLDLQDLLDVVEVHRLDRCLASDEVQFRLRLKAFRQRRDQHELVAQRVVVVQPARQARDVVQFQVELRRVERAR